MNISEAINVYLTNYPRSNKEEFESKFPEEDDYAAVRAILDETVQIQVEWDGMSLSQIGDAVREVLHERHPELSEEAVKHLSNYYTYLVK